MVVGEREIAGQVRRALTTARRDGTTTSGLESLFQAASRVSRDVEARTGLGATGRSVVGVALDIAESELPDWSAVRCVLIGTGSYAGASLAQLKARGCTDVRVYSTTGRARAFAAARGVRSLPAGADLAAEVSDVDLVVACSGAAGAVLGVDALAAARADAAHPLTVVDLALRHDVDPGVRTLPGVRLVSLHTVSEYAPAEHAAVETAHEVVTAAARGLRGGPPRAGLEPGGRRGTYPGARWSGARARGPVGRARGPRPAPTHPRHPARPDGPRPRGRPRRRRGHVRAGARGAGVDPGPVPDRRGLTLASAACSTAGWTHGGLRG